MTGVPVGVSLGIYEKALTGPTMEDLFASAARAGYDFVDLSIDESAERRLRLCWSAEHRDQVRRAAARHGVAIGGLCLSLHRAVAPGSADPAQRDRALDVLVRGIDLAADLGAPVVQVAGYYAYYEEPREGARADYVAVLREGARHAARRGVLLGLENVDGTDVVSIDVAQAVVRDVGSPWFGLYPDLGNFVVQSRDVLAELRAAEGRILALHVKEARPDEPRRVPLGDGDVPWAEAFAELARQGWSGRVMIEMWNDDSPDSEAMAASAREYVLREMRQAGLAVVGPRSGAVQEGTRT